VKTGHDLIKEILKYCKAYNYRVVSDPSNPGMISIYDKDGHLVKKTKLPKKDYLIPASEFKLHLSLLHIHNEKG
jgi:hypothetical protein